MLTGLAKVKREKQKRCQKIRPRLGKGNAQVQRVRGSLQGRTQEGERRSHEQAERNRQFERKAKGEGERRRNSSQG